MEPQLVEEAGEQGKHSSTGLLLKHRFRLGRSGGPTRAVFLTGSG